MEIDWLLVKRMIDKRIGFIGAGKVGMSLGKYFTSKGVPLSGYYSRTMNSAEKAAGDTDTECYASLEQLVEDSQVLFLTVPDREIQTVWKQIREFSIKGKYICHCSGSLSSEEFTEIDRCGAYGYSIHPLYAVRDGQQSFSDVYFTVEGNQQKIQHVLDFFRVLGNPAAVIQQDKKALYHAASVFFSNFVVSAARKGEELFSQCGLEGNFAKKAWHSLFLGNAENIAEKGCVQALTGPVERGDRVTLQKHLNCLDASSAELYKNLSKVLLETAQEKHPERDYSDIEMELNG